MNVLIITENLGIGGAERRLVELLKAFDRYPDIMTHVVVLKNLVKFGDVYVLRNTKISVLTRKIKKDPTIYYRLLKICRQFQPDIIHGWGSMSAVYGFPLARFLRVPFINAMITNAECRKWSKSWWRARLTFPFSDVIQSNSCAGIQAYRVPQNKARVIHNGFDMKRITGLADPENVRTKFDIRTKYVVGMVGTFSEKKDYHTFFRVALDMVSRRNDITFMAVGDGVYFGKFNKMIKGDQRKKIILTGFQEDVESIINIFDIGVLTTYTEGISNAIMEYMALGKPVIATDGGGTSEIIIDKVTGFIIDHAAGEQLKEKIEYLVNNPGQTFVMGKKGQERIINEFSIEKMVNLILDLYTEQTGIAH